jgi:GNAT superfamily N-acetyltransferase
LVKAQFEKVLQPIYGTQDRSLNGIERSTDRKCLLLLADQTPVGILVFKTDIAEVREDSKYTAGCFVIKTLFVINSTDNNGRGYGSCLIDKAITEATERHATGMYVTVSASVPDALKFFQKKGFKIEKEIEGKFTPGVIEYVLTKTLE